MQLADNIQSRPRKALSAAIAAILLCSGQSVLAQQSSQVEAAAGVDEVIVTGTRIRRTDFDQPNAVATLTAEDIDALGIISVSDMLMQMTANVAEYSIDTAGDDSFFVGSTLPNLRGMNPAFGVSRTLTLVDGRRMPGTTNGGAVDLSMVPSVLVGRMETVTGGAGATYGSDAVAGVVNIVLNREIEGTRMSAGFYQTGAGDGDQYNFSIANGTRMMNGRGHLTLGFERQYIDSILNCETARDWCGRSWNFIDSAVGGMNPAPSPSDPRLWEELPPIANPRLPGNPRYGIYEDVRRLHSSRTGSVHVHNNQPLDDPYLNTLIQFTPDGRSIVPYQTSLSPEWYNYALVAGAGARVVGGEGDLFSQGAPLRQGSDRDNFYGRFIYAFNDHTSFTAEVTWGRNEASVAQNSAGRHQQDVCVTQDNAFRDPMFMDAEANQALLNRGTATACSFIYYDYRLGAFFGGPPSAPGTLLRKNWADQMSEARTESKTDTWRVTLSGQGGLFGGRNWQYDAYLAFGGSDRYQGMINNPTNRRRKMALDSIIDPVSGEAVCRVNASNGIGAANRAQWRDGLIVGAGEDTPDSGRVMAMINALAEGCVPLNPFGLAASAEAIDYAWGDLIEYTKQPNTSASVSFSGAIWDGIGAGAFQLATGIDYRETETNNWTGGDPNEYRRTDFSAQYGDPWRGGTKNADIFAELELPLLRGLPGADYMMLNLSSRRARQESYRVDPEESLTAIRYSDSHKVSFVYNPINWMRIRTTRSMDIRQPSVRELFYRQTFSSSVLPSTVQNPWRDVADPQDVYTSVIGSNPGLRNELSVTNTLGFVFTPSGWGRGLQFSVDYYKIFVKDGISYANPSDPDNEDNLPYAVFRCYQYDDPYYCALIRFGEPDALEPGNPRSNIEEIWTSQENSEPFWSRGFDISAAYSKRLSGGGSYSVRLMGTRSLEQSICTDITRISATETQCNTRDNVVGQTGGLRGGGIFSNYTPTPTWSGNLFGTYRKNAFSFTAQARFTGSALGSVFWVGPEDPRWEPDTWFTISQNRMPSWTTWNSTISYDFNQSRFAVDRLNQLSVSLNIDNMFDKQPNFWSGGRIAGVNTRFYNGIGRAYRLNVTMGF